MYSAEEELDEMVARIARRRMHLPTRELPRGALRRRTTRTAMLGHDACGCGTGCGGGCGCGCVSCGGANEAAGLRAARGQTSPGAVSTQLPAWRGWTAPERLSDVIAARAAGPSSGAARAMSEFLAPGPRVYRITRAGVDIDRPLNIGMTISNSILERMLEHHRGPRGDPNVTAAIRNLPASQILVQAAMLTRQGMHPRRAKSYENWLQDRERPLLYSRDTTTFESGAVRRSA
ncbi:MAG: hypothetical protein V4564_18310 [Pseudomonadota bacterium]|uniref:hypothetical protein n=1 Tax=Sphingomonas sp. ERG5 TaxID=1381597 RepID=UPI00054B99FC|nr:hypothetical protein [Sphingomonas sp. ERG5]